MINIVLIGTSIFILFYIVFWKQEYISQITKSSKESLVVLNNLKKKLRRIVYNTSYYNFFNKIYLNESNYSFTLDKKYIFLKLKDENDIYYDYNTLIYVLLHEFTHVVCPQTGHTKLFNTILNNLLKRAENIGEYDNVLPLVYKE
ncbi:hypothetical protein AGMMS49579_03830 [Spirochaetia bacterium]|nr:hypothetical protein AGMMS49579_03830 [Spirochaetia bacterium]